MTFNIRLCNGAYLMNCKIIELIMRVRKGGKAEDNYDLVQVECDNWKDIRLVYFNGVIAVPEEFEDGEIQVWNIENLSNNYNDISVDIQNVKKILKEQLENTATFEVQKAISMLQESFDIEANRLIGGQ